MAADLQNISPTALEQALSGDFGLLTKIPKTDLHSHLLLAAPLESYQRLSNLDLAPPPKFFSGYAEFSSYIRAQIIPRCVGLESFRWILKSCLEHLRQDGITYAEVSFDLGLPQLFDCNWLDIIRESRLILSEYSEHLVFAPELGLARDRASLDWRKVVQELFELNFFKSVDLYGQESAAEIENFIDFFKIAKQFGLKTKLHCAEQSDAASALHEIRLIKPNVIQHGVRISEDDKACKTIAELAKDNLLSINLCPTSNCALSIVKDYQQHPIRKFFDLGIPVTINSDDLAIFGCSVSQEFLKLYQRQVFSAYELEQIRLCGLKQKPPKI